MATTSELIDRLHQSIQGGTFLLGQQDVRASTTANGMATTRRGIFQIVEILERLSAGGGGGDACNIHEVVAPDIVSSPWTMPLTALGKKVLIPADTVDPGPFEVVLPDPAELDLGTEVILESPLYEPTAESPPFVFTTSPLLFPELDFPVLKVEVTVPTSSVGGIQGWRTGDPALGVAQPRLVYDVGDPPTVGWMTIKLRVMESTDMRYPFIGVRRDWWYVSNDFEFDYGGGGGGPVAIS